MPNIKKAKFYVDKHNAILCDRTERGKMDMVVCPLRNSYCTIHCPHFIITETYEGMTVIFNCGASPMKFPAESIEFLQDRKEEEGLTAEERHEA